MKRKTSRLHTFFILLQGITAFLGIFLIVIIFANWAAFKAELNYSLQGLRNAVIQPTPTPTPTVAPTATPEPIIEPAHLMIDKLNLDVPLQWNVPADKTLDALNNGVAHMAGTAKLGEIGNLFVSGHSSDYTWKNNPYAAVFALLPKLSIGDTITIRENGKSYVYQVAQTKIVNPDQVDVVNPTTTPVLTLMTCYPIGSTKERYIIHASLVSSPEKPVAINQSNFTAPEIKFR